MGDPSNSFILNSADTSFRERQKSIFDQLNALENDRNKTSTSQVMEVDETPPVNRKTYRAVTKPFRGKESIFKKPQNPVPKNYVNRIPDFKKNPHKWTKYSLDDVRDEDISERSNTKAALSFLNDLKTRKSSGDVPEEGECDLPNKIVFKRHTNINKKPPENDDEKPTFKSSKVVMPEYVVGQKVRKERKNKTTRIAKANELKLDHLLGEEDDD